MAVADRIVNPLVVALLRSRWHGLLSGSVLLLSYTGVRSGRRITIPVSYAKHADRLVILVGRPERKRWWRNLRGSARVTVRVGGREWRGLAEAIAGDADAPALRAYLARFPRAASAIARPEGTVLVRVTPTS